VELACIGVVFALERLVELAEWRDVVSTDPAGTVG
jgi:hypothetical protein